MSARKRRRNSIHITDDDGDEIHENQNILSRTLKNEAGDNESINDDFEVEELIFNTSDEDPEEKNGLDTYISENVESIENYMNTNDLQSKLKRWAVNSEIPNPKINSLLKILRDFNKNIPYDAKSLLGLAIYKKQQRISNNVDHKFTEFYNLNQNLISLETNCNKHIGKVVNSLKTHIDISINEAQNLFKFALQNKEETNREEIILKSLNNDIQLPLKTKDDLDNIHKSINDLQFRNNLIKKLKNLKDEHEFDGAFKRTMTDTFLSNFVLKNYAKKKGFINFDFFSKVLFEAWRCPDMGIEEFTKQFSKSFKRSVDRRFKKK